MCHPAAMDKSHYTFRAASLDDLPMLRAWQGRAHVREWWNDEEPFDAAELADNRVRRWIVSLSGHPFAYMQDYDVHGWEGHHFWHLPPGSRGIDQYIGELEMTGIGHGPSFIAARLGALFAGGAPVVATDPDPRNLRAIAAYRKAGFRVAGPVRDTAWGTILPMELRAEGFGA
jgi:aminoglycoside 6'-N-acetyltransferase